MAGKQRLFANPARPNAAAAGGTHQLWPHLRGDTDFLPAVGDALEKLAASSGEVFDVTSGSRTLAEQSTLYANRASNPYPVAPPTASDPHIRKIAADVKVNGQPIQNVFNVKQLASVGLVGVSGDAVHVQLADQSGTGSVKLLNQPQDTNAPDTSYPGAQTVDDTTSALKSVGDFLGKLADPNLWRRVSQVILGALLLLMGLKSFTGGAVDPLGAAGKVVP